MRFNATFVRIIIYYSVGLGSLAVTSGLKHYMEEVGSYFGLQSSNSALETKWSDWGWLILSLIYINMIMHLVWLMWRSRRSAFDPNSVFSRYSRLASREECLCWSKWIQSNLIESNAVVHMNLMTEFSSAHGKCGVWPGPKGQKVEETCFSWLLFFILILASVWRAKWLP